MYCAWSPMQARTFRLSAGNCRRKIFDTQVENWTAANWVFRFIKGVKSKFNLADVKPDELAFDMNSLHRTIEQFCPPQCDCPRFFCEEHDSSDY